MSEFEFKHLRDPVPKRMTPSEPVPPSPPPVSHYVLPLRWRIVIAGLAFIVAIACFFISWLITTRATGNEVRNKQIADLACQVERLGGKPIDGVKCPPPRKRVVPRSTSTPRKSPSAVQPPTFSPGVSGASPTPGHTSSPRATTSPHPTPRPRHSPTPQPSNCVHTSVVTVCTTPLSKDAEVVTLVWRGDWFWDVYP